MAIEHGMHHETSEERARTAARARFPFVKTMDEFDLARCPSLRPEAIAPFLRPDFVTDGRALVLSGKPGRGKTHLAVALAYRAIQDGLRARFVVASDLSDEIAYARRAGDLARVLSKYTRPDVLVIDEVAYASPSPEDVDALYRVVRERHLRRRALIVTASRPPAEWLDRFPEPDLAAALLDRLLERGTHLSLGGGSMRAPPPGRSPWGAATPSAWPEAHARPPLEVYYRGSLIFCDGPRS